MDFDYQFKFIIVGDSGVGKSCILKRFDSDTFNENSLSTVGIDYVKSILEINQSKIMIQVWDTAGQEEMFSLTSNYYKNTCAVILVYDITRRSTFQHLENWMQKIEDHSNTYCKRILVGNKVDLKSFREIQQSEGQSFADRNALQFLETSAKTSINIEQVFQILAHKIFHDIKTKKIDLDQNKNLYGISMANRNLSKNKDNIKLEYQVEPEKNECCI